MGTGYFGGAKLQCQYGAIRKAQRIWQEGRAYLAYGSADYDRRKTKRKKSNTES